MCLSFDLWPRIFHQISNYSQLVQSLSQEILDKYKRESTFLTQDHKAIRDLEQGFKIKSCGKPHLPLKMFQSKPKSFRAKIIDKLRSTTFEQTAVIYKTNNNILRLILISELLFEYLSVMKYTDRYLNIMCIGEWISEFSRVQPSYQYFILIRDYKIWFIISH